MITRRRKALTLVEVVIVAVILTVLAAALLPQFTDSTDGAKVATAQFNWHSLKAQIEFYKLQHDGQPPTSLQLLTVPTNTQGTTNQHDGPLDCGPYLSEIPKNPWNRSRRVAAGSSELPPAHYSASIGWFYDNATGDLWIVGNQTGEDQVIGP